MIENNLANDTIWEQKAREQKLPNIRLEPIKECGCSKYEHCQSCEEES